MANPMYELIPTGLLALTVCIAVVSERIEAGRFQRFVRRRGRDHA